MSTKHRKGRGMMRRPNPTKASSGSMVAVGLVVLVAAGVGIAIAVTSKKDDKTAAAGTDETNTKPGGSGGDAEDTSPTHKRIVRMPKGSVSTTPIDPKAPRIAPHKYV